MRTNALIIGLLSLFILSSFVSTAGKSQEPIQEAGFEIIEIATGADPQWSPDGKKISFLLDGCMYLANADGEGEIQKLFEIPKNAYRYHWLDSTEFLFQETEQLREEDGRLLEITNRLTGVSLDGTKRVIVEGKQDLDSPFFFSAPLFMPDGTVGYFRFPPGESWVSDDAVFKVIKQGKMRPDSSLKQSLAIIVPVASHTVSGDVWVQSLDKSVKRRITVAKLHSFPQLSPDETKILVALSVLDLKGNETRVGKKGIDTADVSESSLGPIWSPDSRKIAYTRVTSRILDWDGQAIQDIAAEIHIVNADGSGLEIIDIPDVIEFDPVWSPDGTKVACTGKNTGKVYIIERK